MPIHLFSQMISLGASDSLGEWSFRRHLRARRANDSEQHRLGFLVTKQAQQHSKLRHPLDKGASAQVPRTRRKFYNRFPWDILRFPILVLGYLSRIRYRPLRLAERKQSFFELLPLQKTRHFRTFGTPAFSKLSRCDLKALWRSTIKFCASRGMVSFDHCQLVIGSFTNKFLYQKK